MFLVPPAGFVRSPHLNTCYYYQDRSGGRLTTASREGYSQALPGGAAIFLVPPAWFVRSPRCILATTTKIEAWSGLLLVAGRVTVRRCPKALPYS
jgi:hypothetical protein